MPELPESPEMIKCGVCAQLRKLIFFVFLSFLFSLPTLSNAQFIKPNSKAIETAGDVLFYALPASAALTTLVLDDKKGSWQFTKSFIANSAVTWD